MLALMLSIITPYCIVDPSLGLDYSKLRLICAFEHGLNPSSSEGGFVLIYIAMIKQSGLFVKGIMNTLGGIVDHDRDAFDASLEKVIEAWSTITKSVTSDGANGASSERTS